MGTSYLSTTSTLIECARVMVLLGHMSGLLDQALSVFLCLSTPSKIFISRCDLRHSIREYVIVLEWMGPGCDTVTGGSLRIVPIKTLLLAQVCSDCLVNYNVGLFELYNWQIYICQEIICFC